MAAFITADAYKAEGNTFFKSADYSNAVKQYTMAIEMDSTVAVYYSNRSASYRLMLNFDASLSDAQKAIELRPEWNRGYDRKGMVLYDMKKVDESIAVYREGLRVCGASDVLTEGLTRGQRFVAGNEKRLQQIYDQLGLRQSRGMMGESLAFAEMAVKFVADAYGEGAVNMQAAGAQTQLCGCLFRAGHVIRAKAVGETAVAMMETCLDRNPGSDELIEEMGKALGSLGSAVLGKHEGDHDAALQLFEHSNEVMKQHSMNPHPIMVFNLGNMSTVHLNRTKNYAKAEECVLQAIEFGETIFDKNHPNVAMGYMQLEIIYSQLNRLQEAVECGNTAIEMFTAFGLPTTHPQVKCCMQNMATNREKLGMINDTLTIYREELENLKILEPFDPVAVCGKLDQIIQVHKRANQVAEFLPLAEEGLAIAQDFFPPNHVTIADFFTYNAEANMRLDKDLPVALTAYKAALQIYNTLPKETVTESLYTTCVYNIPMLERVCALGEEKRA